MITFLFALIYKFLRDVEIGWNDVWIGAAITSLLFTIGKFLIGLYLGRSTVGSAYGAAGSLVVILIWVYYSAQILFFAAEFTQVYANRYGSRIEPVEDAMLVTHEHGLRKECRPDNIGSELRAFESGSPFSRAKGVRPEILTFSRAEGVRPEILTFSRAEGVRPEILTFFRAEGVERKVSGLKY